MALITGTLNVIDALQQAHLVGGDLRTGSFHVIDSTHQAYFSGILLSDSTYIPQDATFIQGSLTDSLSVTFWDSTYTGGTLTDGTYVGGAYLTRTYNPVWLNYSIWYLQRPDGTASPVGFTLRTAANPSVGQFYANIYAPDEPGLYEIRWRYQKEPASLAHEIISPFRVTSWGITSDATYN